MTRRSKLPPYSAHVVWSDEDEAFIATLPEMPYVSAHGPTAQEAVSELQTAIALSVASLQELGQPVPPPRKLEPRSGQLRLRLPRSLHRELVEAAEGDGISLNQLILGFIERGMGQRDARGTPRTHAATGAVAYPTKDESRPPSVAADSTRRRRTPRKP